MKKLIRPTLLVFVSLLLLVVFLSRSNAQAQSDCRKIFNKESYQCLKDSSACQDACQKETEKPDGTVYFNSGEIYQKCIKASDCSGKSSACSEQALASFRACGESDNQPRAAEVKKETPKFVPKFVEVLNTLPLDTVTVTFLDPKDPNKFKIEEDSDVPQDIKELFEKFKPMTNEEFQRLWNSKPDDLAANEDKKVQKWGDESGAVMSSSSWEDIKFKEPVKNSTTQEILRMVEIDQGQLEVKLKEPDLKNNFGVQGDFFDLFVIQTHFWVGQSQDEKSAIIAVYEGEVEVKTKDGKAVKVKPDGDKPGVVVVSQKLSVAKLAVVGVVLAAIFGGIFFILKKKSSSKRK